MKIAGMEKLSLQDYPNHMSCIIFTQGCNMRCPFCHNSSLIPLEGDAEVSEEEFFEYIEKRKNMLDGVTISGGEPTVQKDLKDFIKKVKAIGYEIKLDTNGMNFSLLKELIDEKLVDYVAMDIKNNVHKYGTTSGVNNIVLDNINKSIELLKENKVDHEFRTTIVSDFHTLDDIYDIIKVIGDSKYYLQNFKLSDAVIDQSLKSFTEEELLNWNKKLENYPNVYIRGIEKGK